MAAEMRLPDGRSVRVETIMMGKTVGGLRFIFPDRELVLDYAALPTPTHPEDRSDVEEQLQVWADGEFGVGMVRIEVRMLTPPFVQVAPWQS